jgi:hypothetical protein
MKIFIICISLFCLSLRAMIIDETTAGDPRIKSHRFYRLGFKEYRSKQYVESVEHIEKALKIFPRHKKAKELLQELRAIGLEYYNTGLALVYFDRTMSMDFLNKASHLLDPKDIKRKKISRIIERLEHNGTDHARQQEPLYPDSAQGQGKGQEDS